MCKPFGKRCEMHCFDLFHVRASAHFKRLRILPIHTRTHTTIINTLTHSHFLSVPRCRDFFKAHALAFALHRSYGYCLSIEWVERVLWCVCVCLIISVRVRVWGLDEHMQPYADTMWDTRQNLRISDDAHCAVLSLKKNETDALCWTLFSLVISREWSTKKKKTHISGPPDMTDRLAHLFSEEICKSTTIPTGVHFSTIHRPMMMMGNYDLVCLERFRRIRYRSESMHTFVSRFLFGRWYSSWQLQKRVVLQLTVLAW